MLAVGTERGRKIKWWDHTERERFVARFRPSTALCSTLHMFPLYLSVSSAAPLALPHAPPELSVRVVLLLLLVVVVVVAVRTAAALVVVVAVVGDSAAVLDRRRLLLLIGARHVGRRRRGR